MSGIAFSHPSEMVHYLGSDGVSTVAQNLKSKLGAVGRHLEETISSVRAHLTNLAVDVYYQCGRDNWDGLGARAVSARTLTEAQVLISYMPTSVIEPVLDAEPSGAIGFEWENFRGDILIASVLAKGTVSFAALFMDGSKIRGLEKFSGSLPPRFGRVLVDHFLRSR